MTTLDPVEAAKRREEGIARSDEAAYALWRQYAEEAVRVVARRQETFSTDDVWEELDSLAPGLDTPEHRALGAVMRVAVHDGVAELASCAHCGTTKVVRQSKRRIANRRDTPIYRSLLHVAQAVPA